MANHPLNLAIRALLELVALIVFAMWGWRHGGVLPAIALPLLAASAWGVFRVPNDGGTPVVRVSGLVRLLLEAVFFSAAVAAAADHWSPAIGAQLAGAVIAHYALSYDRVLRLLKGNAA